MKTKKKILLSAVPIIAVAAVLLSLMLFRGGRLAVGSEEPAEGTKSYSKTNCFFLSTKSINK